MSSSFRTNIILKTPMQTSMSQCVYNMTLIATKNRVTFVNVMFSCLHTNIILPTPTNTITPQCVSQMKQFTRNNVLHLRTTCSHDSVLTSSCKNQHKQLSHSAYIKWNRLQQTNVLHLRHVCSHDFILTSHCKHQHNNYTTLHISNGTDCVTNVLHVRNVESHDFIKHIVLPTPTMGCRYKMAVV